jgi:hypothetical protein
MKRALSALPRLVKPSAILRGWKPPLASFAASVHIFHFLGMPKLIDIFQAQSYEPCAIPINPEKSSPLRIPFVCHTLRKAAKNLTASFGRRFCSASRLPASGFSGTHYLKSQRSGTRGLLSIMRGKYKAVAPALLKKQSACKVDGIKRFYDGRHG